MNWFVKKNRRTAARHRYDGSDTWIQLEGSLVRQCQVLDLSRTGVRLRVANAHSLPYTFNLLLSKNGTGRPARVRWRRDNELGAEFFKADSSSTSPSTVDPPRANSRAASRSSAAGPRANSSSAKASRPPKQRSPDGHKSEAPLPPFSLHVESEKPPVSTLLAGAGESVGSISGDKAESDCQMCDAGEQLDRADQKKSGKQGMDLSRLQKKLGPKHIALIHALKDIDPESPHGQELAAIIESLD